MFINAKFDMRFEDFHLQAEMNVPVQGVTTLFGPSGSGKSTFLRCIAGLERSPTGFLQVAGEIWQDEKKSFFLPVHQRALAYVFQEPRLFFHLNVKKNLMFGYTRTPVAERKVDIDDIISLLNLEHLLSRKPSKLSGGEQQRVSIGRALLASPKLLLMDEPLAGLDMARKREILPFIRKLHDELKMPIVYVSHGLQEVLQMTDTLVLMEGGKNIASGRMTDICSTLELSAYLGDMSGAIIETTIIMHEPEYGLTQLVFPGGKLSVPQQSLLPGASLRVHILARNVGIALAQPQETTSFLNILEATVTEIIVPDNSKFVVQIKLDVGVPLLAYISRKSLHLLKLTPGQKCYALIKAVSLAQDFVDY